MNCHGRELPQGPKINDLAGPFPIFRILTVFQFWFGWYPGLMLQIPLEEFETDRIDQ